MHTLAKKANAALPDKILTLLSERGRAAYFPSAGILGQSAQAKTASINATIGIALADDGSPMYLPGLGEQVDLDAKGMFPYAPSYGKPELRDQWLVMTREKNPSLADSLISRPVVTNALTHALSVAGQLFIDPGQTIIMPDLFWGNYRLVFEQAMGARISTFPTFDAGGGFNVDGLRDALRRESDRKSVVLLNFPNNPTGYTCTATEANAIETALVDAADSSPGVVAIIDDAYFGLVYEDGVLRESIFSTLASAHPNLLAAKVDGATKEDFAWGFRVGFLTFGYHQASVEGLGSLADKAAGLVRGSISNASHLSQSLLLQAYRHADYPQWKAAAYEALNTRYRAVRDTLESHPEYQEQFTALPFNSGYFMCVKPTSPSVEVERVRQLLLKEFDTGLIATGQLLRVAFSSAPTHRIPQLFHNLNEAIKATAGGG